MPWVDEEQCGGCGSCVDVCPTEAITLNDNNIAVIDMNKCEDCGACIDACPTEAIKPGAGPNG